MTVKTVFLSLLTATLMLAEAPLMVQAAGHSNNAPVTKESLEETIRETTKRVQQLPGRRRQGANQALDLMRTTSPELCRLTGLDYVADTAVLNSAKAQMADDGEDLSEELSENGPAIAEDAQLDDNGQVIGDAGEDLDELEEENPEETPVDITSFRSLWLSYVDADGDDMTPAGVEKQQLMNVILDWLGTQYRFGGATRRGIDCSAFTRMLYEETAGIELPRTANVQYGVGQRIERLEELEFGDLVFFKTRRYATITHVGMYLGDNLFAHASSRYGVTISSLESGYYNSRFRGGSRLTDRDLADLEIPTADAASAN